MAIVGLAVCKLAHIRYLPRSREDDVSDTVLTSCASQHFGPFQLDAHSTYCLPGPLSDALELLFF